MTKLMNLAWTTNTVEKLLWEVSLFILTLVFIKSPGNSDIPTVFYIEQ